MKKTEKQILIFGGTTEGRMAAERLLAEGVLCTVCVATEYGSEVMEPHPLLTVHVGRMDRMEMVDMMGGEVYACFRAEQAERAARRKLCCVLFMER